MKKSFIVLLVLIMIITSSACSSGTINAKDIVQNYAQATINAWYYGLNEDCIYENENCKDGAESENHIDFNQLVETTGFERSEIRDVFLTDVGEISIRTVNNYHNSFIHFDALQNVGTYNDIESIKGNKPGITQNGYADVCYNMEMVRYLFEKIYQPKLETYFSSNNSDENAKLKEVKQYIDAVINDCLNDSNFTNTFAANYNLISQRVQQVCNEKLGIQIEVKPIY